MFIFPCKLCDRDVSEKRFGGPGRGAPRNEPVETWPKSSLYVAFSRFGFRQNIFPSALSLCSRKTLRSFSSLLRKNFFDIFHLFPAGDAGHKSQIFFLKDGGSQVSKHKTTNPDVHFVICILQWRFSPRTGAQDAPGPTKPAKPSAHPSRGLGLVSTPLLLETLSSLSL